MAYLCGFVSLFYYVSDVLFALVVVHTRRSVHVCTLYGTVFYNFERPHVTCSRGQDQDSNSTMTTARRVRK